MDCLAWALLRLTRTHYSWSDYSLNIRLGRAVSSVRMALFGIHALLEKGAKDCRVNLGPVLCSGTVLFCDELELETR